MRPIAFRQAALSIFLKEVRNRRADLPRHNAPDEKAPAEIIGRGFRTHLIGAAFAFISPL
jgi:hypothetical protein